MEFVIGTEVAKIAGRDPFVGRNGKVREKGSNEVISPEVHARKVR
jgi:hypothetical protein